MARIRHVHRAQWSESNQAQTRKPFRRIFTLLGVKAHVCVASVCSRLPLLITQGQFKRLNYCSTAREWALCGIFLSLFSWNSSMTLTRMHLSVLSASLEQQWGESEGNLMNQGDLQRLIIEDSLILRHLLNRCRSGCRCILSSISWDLLRGFVVDLSPGKRHYMHVHVSLDRIQTPYDEVTMQLRYRPCALPSALCLFTLSQSGSWMTSNLQRIRRRK